jgi:hypothetical protein
MLVDDSSQETDADHRGATVAFDGQSGVEVCVEGDRDTVLLSTPGEERSIIGGGKADLTRVNDVEPLVSKQFGRPARDALVEEVLHEAVGRSAVSSPTIAAA